MSCTHSADCPLFAQFAMEPAQLSLKGEVVPIALMPNGKMLENKVKSKEEMGGTALFNAILKGRVSMVKSMFSSKMSTVQVTSSDGSTPLMAAASVGNLEIINLLLEAGCNPFNTNNNNINALAVAEKKKFPDCAKVIKEFMLAHPNLKGEVSATEKPATSKEQETEIKGIVSMLKKLNPFSR